MGRCDFKPACSHRILNSCTCSKSPRIQTAPGFHSAHPLTAGAARAGARRDPSEPPQLAAIPAQAAGKPMETPKIACSAARHQPHCACVHSLLSLSNCKLKILTEIRSLFCCFDLLEDYAFQVLDLLQFGFRNGWTCQIVPY